MFDFLSSNKGKRRDDRLLPMDDFKMGPFKIGSTSNSPNSECAYTALTSSTETAVDIPNSQCRHSASSLDRFNETSSPPPGYKPPSYYSTLLGVTHRRAKSSSRRCKFLTLAAIVLPCLYIFCYIIFRPPNYIVLPPERYVEVLKDTLNKHIPSQSVRQALTDHLAQIQHPDPAPTPAQPVDASGYPKSHSVVPPTIWSSDGKPAPAAWFTKWSTMGFEPKFLDDVGAEEWIKTHFDNTSVKAMWDSMPRFILKADLLRYLLLLEEGGTWSDMDTVPLMHRTNWTKDAVPLASILPEDKGIFGRASLASTIHAARAVSGATEPVRAVIGIENDPNENPSPRNFLERWRLLPMRRHRPLQFVQWTLHTAPNHPIMLDVLRRILQATDVYHAHTIEAEREAHSDGWGWDEKSIEDKKEQARLREAHDKETNPWEAVSMSWKWQAGHWRWGWNILSVEEWTGPAVWTDAVVSYLYASAGVRPEDLSGLRQPVQIRDVVIVPSNGFNPSGGTTNGKSRLVHLFRGSWKG